MKQFLLLLATCFIFQSGMNAQNSLTININHKLGVDTFALYTAAKTTLDQDIAVTRLEYYISGISIIHDGGTETAFDQTWILVNASQPAVIDLGTTSIESVEMLKLHVGVDSAHNHLDPASYQSSHPLAPKSPSMHWGWSPGYRFIAYEGQSGVGFNQTFELHGLGDQNYFTTEIPITAIAENNAIVLNLDADYTRGLDGIDLSSGLIVHGSNLEDKQCLENFRDSVFSEAAVQSTSSIGDWAEVGSFVVFPNPTTDGTVSITLDAPEYAQYTVSTTDLLGREIAILESVAPQETITFDLSKAGVYFVTLFKDGQPVITRKLISK